MGGHLSRRRFLRLAGLTALGAACGPIGRLSPPPAEPGTGRLEALADQLVAVTARDGIPAIDAPRFTSAAEMDRFLRPEDAVFVLYHGGEVRVYPQLVLVWHEVVNDQVAGEKVAVTYCPLTGSVVAFQGRAPDGDPLTFGTSGQLLNSNLVMHDRQTGSRWPQLLGQAISGPLRGRRLEEIPLVWTSWELWKTRGREAPVLSFQTGHARPYGRDPYGSYSSARQGYYGDDAVLFPVAAQDDRFRPKEVVIGAKVGGTTAVVPKRAALDRGVWNLEVAGEPLVAVRERELEVVWLFSRRLGHDVLSLRAGQDGGLLEEGGRGWRRRGAALRAPDGGRLPALNFYDVMWFAWYAFYPETRVVTA